MANGTSATANNINLEGGAYATTVAHHDPGMLMMTLDHPYTNEESQLISNNNNDHLLQHPCVTGMNLFSS